LRSYEAMYILHPDFDEEKHAALIDRFVQIVTNDGDEVTRLEKWGKRRLAYEIAHNREGYYVVMKFKAPPHTARELDRVFKITDGVLRHIIVREDE